MTRAPFLMPVPSCRTRIFPSLSSFVSSGSQTPPASMSPLSSATATSACGRLMSSTSSRPRCAAWRTSTTRWCAYDPFTTPIFLPFSSAGLAMAELKGKKIGVVKGSYAHHLVVLVLQAAHLGLEDVELINLPHADVAVALERGDIDAGGVWEPLLTKLESEGKIRVLQDGTGIKKGALVITARDAFASRNPELVQTFLRLYKRGEELVRDHPDEAAELISRDVKLSPERLRIVLAKSDFDPALHPDDVEELKRSEAFMRSVGITKTAVDIDAFIDGRYALAADAR